LWVIKIGGSLLNRMGEQGPLIRTLARISRKVSIALLPGGGKAADLVRALDHRYGIGSEASHWMAVQTMHLNAYRLAVRDPEIFAPTSLLGDLPEGRIPVILPLDRLSQSALPRGWQVTSDSIAALFACELDAELAILKTVDGVFDSHPSGRLMRSISTRELASLPSSPLDDYLPALLDEHDMNAWILNGMFPERLERLLRNEGTIATRIHSGKG
jgi:aspartokinase-like uncharacterized kinase